MRIVCYLSFVVTFLLQLSCVSHMDSKEDLIHINVKDDYPEVDLYIDDIADIEYVCMEEKDGFFFKGVPKCITENTFVFHNSLEGDFIFFTKGGSAKSRFNHKGNGPNEYPFCYKVLYDEIKDELFVETVNKILVYNSLGEYKRSFRIPKNIQIGDIVNYDSCTFLLYNSNENSLFPFLFLSKENGNVIDSICLKRGQNVKLSIIQENDNSMFIVTGMKNNIVRYKEGFLLTDYTSDTVYFYNEKKNIVPFLTRKPSIHKMDPIIYLNSMVESFCYQFFRSVYVKNEHNRLPSTYLVRDKQNGVVYKQRVFLRSMIGRNLKSHQK